MKVNSKILSIPPYISCSWENISSLHLDHKGDTKSLVIHLVSGSRLEIPGLNNSTLLQIFQSHEQYLEEIGKESPPQNEAHPQSLSFGFPLKINGDQFESFMKTIQEGGKMAPLELSAELLSQINDSVKMLGLGGTDLLDHPLYAKLEAMLSSDKPLEPIQDEEISDEDLRFKEWEITEISQNLYKVINPLDLNEEYQVFLGTPVGCTCGLDHCDHIKAVLKS